MRVVIVEPHAEKRRILTEKVEASGHAALAEPTITAALHLLRREPIDGVVLGSAQADLPAEMALRLCQSGGRPACVVGDADDEALDRLVASLEEKKA